MTLEFGHTIIHFIYQNSPNRLLAQESVPVTVQVRTSTNCINLGGRLHLSEIIQLAHTFCELFGTALSPLTFFSQ